MYGPRMPRLLLALMLSLPLVAAPALAQDEDEDTEELEEEEVDEGVDDRGTYEGFKKDLTGESPSEEIDAWYRYLEAYPRSMFRLEIERRIEALEEAAFEELMKERADSDGEDARVDARRQEMDVAEPAFVGIGANPRRRFEFGLLWGYSDFINYDLTVEWAFLRKLSVFGGVNHVGRAFGATINAGVKYALVKDVRTGIVLSGAFTAKLGYNGLDRLHFIIEPQVLFAWLPSDLFQLQTSLAFDLRLDRLNHWVLWDLMAVISPTDVFGFYVESKQRHQIKPVSGVGTQYMAFFQAGVGVKIKPTPLIELTVGANVPYFWRLYKDYEYVGVHADVVFYFASKPKT